MFSGRIFSPSPTVRSSRIPFYMRGVGLDLGQVDTSLPVGPVDITPPDFPIPVDTTFSPGMVPSVDPATAPLIAAGLDPNTADLVYAAASNGNITDAQLNQILAGGMTTDQINNIVFGIPGSQLPTGPLTSPAQQQAAALAQKAGGSPAQIAKAVSSVTPQSTPAQIASAVAGAMKTVTGAALAPAPRVAFPPATSFLTQSSILPGVPDVALIGGALLLLLAAGGKR